MPSSTSTAIQRALQNIVAFGDTDVFPFPLERYLFDDKLDECADLALERSKHFEKEINSHPPINIDTQSQVGYTGFRHVTLIDPLWNVYYLALVLSIAKQIEDARVPLDEGRVFSYRYDWNKDKSSIFRDVTWVDYRDRSLELSQRHEFVIMTDIADHYARINHHRLENNLDRICPGAHVKRLMRLLQNFSNRKSYGIPVGGPASRTMAEASLINIDRLLLSEGIEFVRYADDYNIFCNSQPCAYKSLVKLSDYLSMEGLSLQKSKTKILPSSEFQQLSALLDPTLADASTDEQRLLHLAIRFDPYSPNAEDDYDALRDAVKQVDILGILSREIRKTTIDRPVARQAIGALRALPLDQRESALHVLLDPANLRTLSPVFPQIMRAVRGTYERFDRLAQERLAVAMLKLANDGDYILDFDLNLAYFVQALSKMPQGSAEQASAERFLVGVYSKPSNPLVRRMIIHTMANWRCHYHISDYIRNFNSCTSWERNALLISCYCLGDEGKHWRIHNSKGLSAFEGLVNEWAAERHQSGRIIPV